MLNIAKSRISEHLKYFRYLCQRHRKCTTLIDPSKTKQEQLKARQREIMARGLPKQKQIKNVKQILLVASGKGGVGKSTTAVNLATALKIVNPEKSVGLLDADVFGPSIPTMMNIHESPMVNRENFMEPLVNYGVKCMSMGFLIGEEAPVIWRGLMVMDALDKLLNRVAWGLIDYLVIDTPPGTGDTHLSLVQNIFVTGVLLVTTPQKIALEVTKRGANMFKKLNVPVAGIVENMSTITCPKCMSEVPLFGNDTSSLAKEIGVDILQRIPMHDSIAESSDSGKPIVLLAPKSKQAEAYKELAERVIVFLHKQQTSNETNN